MPDMSFVVLHYLNYAETNECIESLLQLDDFGSNKIVVIDNNSGNGSYERLCDTYSTTDSVILRHLDDNLGFARGNDAGYRIAREELGSDTIIILNNDVKIQQSDFIERVEEFRARGYDVIGPDVYDSRRGTHQNPFIRSDKYMKEYLLDSAWYLYYKVLPWSISSRLFNFVRRKTMFLKTDSREGIAKTQALYRQERENVLLHGSCLVFTNHFVQNEVIAFDPRTFLYHEEVLLEMHCKDRGYKMIYAPSLRVVHNSSASDDMVSDAELKNAKLTKLSASMQSNRVVRRVIRQAKSRRK